METIGQRLKEWRKSKGLTTLDINKATGLSTGGLSAYERDEKQIGSKSLIALWEEYDIDISWILTGKKETDLLPEEQKLLEHYRASDLTGKELINDYAASIENKFPSVSETSSSSKIG